MIFLNFSSIKSCILHYAQTPTQCPIARRVSVHPTRIKSHTRFQFVYSDFVFSLSSLFDFLCIDRWSHLDRIDRIETHNYERVRVSVSASLCEHLEWSNAELSEFIIKIWFLFLSNPFNLLRFRFPTERKPTSIRNDLIYKSGFSDSSLCLSLNFGTSFIELRWQ